MNRNSADLGITRRAVNVITDYWGHLKLFSRNARLFLVGIFFVGLNWAIFTLLLNLYLRGLGFREDLIGGTLSFTAWGMTIIAPRAAST